MTTNPDELAVARATNQRLNRRAQELESELASYRRAVADWEISEDSTYVPLRSLAVIAKAAGLEVPERWELHYQRLERAEAGLRRLAAEAPTTTKPEPLSPWRILGIANCQTPATHNQGCACTAAGVGQDGAQQ